MSIKRIKVNQALKRIKKARKGKHIHLTKHNVHQLNGCLLTVPTVNCLLLVKDGHIYYGSKSTNYNIDIDNWHHDHWLDTKVYIVNTAVYKTL